MPAALANGPPQGTALALGSFSDTTPVVIDAADQPLSLTVDDVLRYIAPGAPRHEALMFLMTCKAMRINPLLKEAFLIPAKDKWVTVVAKSGYLKAAQHHESYNGHEAGIVAQPYDKSKVRQGQPPPYTGPPVDLEGSLLPDGYLLVGGWAKIWRKGIDRPITSRVSMIEYDRKHGTWLTIPCTMIRKVPLVHVIREAFAMGGYDEAEMPIMQEPGQATVRVDPPESQAWVAPPQAPQPEPGPRTVQVITHDPAARREKPAALPPDMAAKLQDLMTRAGLSDFQINTALVKRGVDRIEDLDVPSATQMINKIEASLSVAEWDPLGGAGKADDAGKSPKDDPATEPAATADPTDDPDPRQREPGDDDEPFDDATGRVLSDSAEIAEEFDKPLDAATAAGPKDTKKGGKKTTATTVA